MSDPQLQTAGARDAGGRSVKLDHVALPSLVFRKVPF